MQHSNSQNFSQASIDALFKSSYFVDKFQQLQLQTYNDLIQVQSIIQTKINIKCTQQNSIGSPASACNSANNTANQKKKTARAVQTDQLVGQISQLILQNFREAMLRQTNSLYQNKINAINIMDQIQNIKQSISKMSQTSSFVTISAKALTTQESITPDTQEKKDEKYHKKTIHSKNIAETSMFMCDQQQSSIELGSSRKNLAEDRLTSFSFMNSFLNQNKISPQQEEIINQRINASISKIESSIDDRISQLEKEFNRRIQQIMKTIKHLIHMINQNEGLQGQKQFEKNEKMNKPRIISVEQDVIPLSIRKVAEIPKTVITSKSTIIMPQYKKIEKQVIRAHVKEHMKTEPSDMMQISSPIKSEKQANFQKSAEVQQNLFNKSSSKLVSFFKLGKTNNPNK